VEGCCENSNVSAPEARSPVSMILMAGGARLIEQNTFAPNAARRQVWIARTACESEPSRRFQLARKVHRPPTGFLAAALDPWVSQIPRKSLKNIERADCSKEQAQANLESPVDVLFAGEIPDSTNPDRLNGAAKN